MMLLGGMITKPIAGASMNEIRKPDGVPGFGIRKQRLLLENGIETPACDFSFRQAGVAG